MTPEEFGVYCRLLFVMWRHEGRLKDDDSELATIGGLTLARWRKIKEKVMRPMTIAGGQVSQKRLTATWLDVQELRRKRALAADKRWAGNKSSAKHMHVHMPGTVQVSMQNDAIQNQIRNITSSEQDPRARPSPAEEKALLSRLELLKSRNGRDVFVEVETPEWAAHNHARSLENLKPLIPVTVVINGVEKTGQWLASKIPAGYDEATGERVPPTSDEAAA